MQGRLTRLRAHMKSDGLDGFIVPHTDEFQGEYIPAHAERLKYISGFTGSAGEAIVLADKAVFFTNGLYAVQTSIEVSKAEFEILNVMDVTPAEWIVKNLPAHTRLGYDPWLHTPNQIEKLQAAVEKADAVLVSVTHNPIDAIWDHRPAAPHAPIFLHPLEFAGETSDAKRTLLAEKLRGEKVQAAILTDPSSVAWLLNVRGSDIPHNPLPLSFAILHDDGAVDWFVDPAKRGDLHIEGVRVHPFHDFHGALGTLMGKRVLADPAQVPSCVFEGLRGGGAEIVRGPDPCHLPMACKNEVEQQGARAAHKRDGAALANFLSWYSAADQLNLTELDIVERLEQFRAKSNLYRGPSFDTIACAGNHGGNIHYLATKETSCKLDNNSVLLIDSGGQYQDGTTDITRTLAVGTPRADMREIFTLVLKGHIALATVRFPKGTTGVQLDILARQFLWARGLDYKHSTGHLVGSYLSVHEPPGRVITPRGDGMVLQPGMIVSNEPGYYEENEFGIRIENLMLVKQGDHGDLEFETISFAPIDRALIVTDMLSRTERTWLNLYHMRVLEVLRPLVDKDAMPWLEKACEPL